MELTRPVRRLPALLVLAILATMMVALTAPRAHADAAGGGGDYVPLSGFPTVLDTRSGTGGVTGERGEASTTTFPILGVGGVPTSGVGSVLVRIALLNPTEATWAELWPDGTTRPTLSMISAGKGEDISNTAIVKVGANGKLALYNASGKTHVVVDVQGYFKSSQGTTGGGFVPLEPAKVVDTRDGTGTTAGTIAAGASRTFTLGGGQIPAGSAAAVVNLTVPGATAIGWLTAGPGTSTGRPMLSYETGSTQSGAVLPLSADGKVTIRNNGSAAVNLTVTVRGYFAASANQGAGLRQVAKRLLNTRTVGAGLPVAANSTVDVQVGGTNGLPTRGIAGVAVNIVATPTEAGYLKVFPAGPQEPAPTSMDFKADIWRSNMVVVKPGTDGKIRIRNGSSGTTHVIVDLLGWFADPLPAVPIAQNTRISALNARPVGGANHGTIQYAYVDNAGRVVWGRQDNIDVVGPGAVTWQVISGNEAFTGQPTILQLENGRIQISAQYTDGDIWSATQTEPGSATWTDWADLGGSMASAPAAGKLGDGTPVQFASDVDGKLWAYAQTGSVPFWRNLGDQDIIGRVEVAPVRDGLQVFALTTAGSIKTIRYVNDGSVSAWTDLGGLGLTGTPAVVVRPGFLPQVFVRAGDGTVVSKTQTTGGAWPTEWTPVGGLPADGSPAALLDPLLGRVVVVTRGADNDMRFIWETSTGSNTWGTVHEIADDPGVTDPSMVPFTNTNGDNFLMLYRNLNGSVRYFDRSVSGS